MQLNQKFAKGCSQLFGSDVIYHASQCSHGRVWKYYAESVIPGNKNNFLSTKCMLEDKTINCDAKIISWVSLSIQRIPKAFFILKTNEKCPFGQNSTTTGINVCKIFKKELAIVRFFKNLVKSNIYSKTYAANPF